MLEIGNKLINKVNVDGQELTFTLVDFSDDEISGKIAVQGNFTQADDYNTNNQILNTLLSKHQVNQRTMNYLSANIAVSGLTTPQAELAKAIAFRNNFKNKKFSCNCFQNLMQALILTAVVLFGKSTMMILGFLQSQKRLLRILFKHLLTTITPLSKFGAVIMIARTFKRGDL